MGAHQRQEILARQHARDGCRPARPHRRSAAAVDAGDLAEMPARADVGIGDLTARGGELHDAREAVPHEQHVLREVVLGDDVGFLGEQLPGALALGLTDHVARQAPKQECLAERQNDAIFGEETVQIHRSSQGAAGRHDGNKTEQLRGFGDRARRRAAEIRGAARLSGTARGGRRRVGTNLLKISSKCDVGHRKPWCGLLSSGPWTLVHGVF